MTTSDMTTANPSDENEVALTQLNYKSSDYADQSWEVIGEISEVIEFVPMEIEVLPNHEFKIDKMFADYGGRTPESTKSLWHLPEGLNYESELSRRQEEEEEEEPKQSFTEAELNELLRQAEERGKDLAAQEMILMQNERLSAIEQSLQNIVMDMQKQVEEANQQTVKEALELAINIAEKIMHHTVEVNPEYVSKILDEAVSLCGSSNIFKIRISPQDMEFIELVGVSKKLKGMGTKWNFESDPTVRAGCVIETSAGEVDYQLDQAFERVKENIIKIVR